MPLLLTLLSVLATWSFLGVLIIGLFLILKPLHGVRGTLERIAWGVRAIEQQLLPYGADVARAARNLNAAAEAFDGLKARAERVDRASASAAPHLRVR